ncbi:putative fatty acyl-CoA reductase CG8306 [Anoplophora glabripennis]|uniref:putative fatty acyl-CoA reductase CG8306 n=1 Tax=Anoplophora glabripennis TaxID=217634 RepID=UPI0008750791|nr:putative fatty acyl-CoA reductase CG8306 [Anoplophora glabripennis]XP_018571924.1 putative fatty acyl-CoA reductase CG8306 [Anoplophora glabripennis]
MSSSVGVRGFYSGKNLFITGASGFLGICLLEKILRTIPDHGDIYLLLRPKKGKEIAERLEEIKKNQVFEVVLKEKSVEKVFARVKAVAGDVGQDNLGLSPGDRKLLTDNVNIIFHLAATLDFADTLKTTVDINLLGTRRVIELAKQCPGLNALVHVSSAYVNSWRSQADEEIYPLKRDPEDVIAMVNKLTPEELEEQTPNVLGDHPNTYTITKHMAELEIQKVEKLFPCTIVRPSMIVGAWKEPVPGWTISKNGPQGFFMGASKGVIRRLPVGRDLIYDYIPVDIVVNNMLTAGFYVGVLKPKTVAVFHSTSSTRNPFRWVAIEDQINEYLHRYPLKSAVWYPHLKLLPSVTWYKISAFFVHFFPAILLDTVTRLGGGRPILMKLHRNVNSSLDRLEKFIFTEWRYSSMQTMNLQEWLNEGDKVDYNLDIGTLSWKDYFLDLTLGSRVYLSKDPEKTLPAAKSREKILLAIHLAWQAMLFSLIWFIFACVTGMTMSSSVFVLPILFVLYNLL